MRGMRPKKGDLYIVLNDGQFDFRLLIHREQATGAQRETVRELTALAVKAFLVEGDAAHHTPEGE